MNAQDLYLEETFTDRRVGTIRRLTPVDENGVQDASRPVQYIGQTQILTPMGTLPLSFELAGATLGEAAESFADAAAAAVDDTRQQLEEMRREAASGLIVPGSGAAGGVPGPDALGGMPSGKIRMP